MVAASKRLYDGFVSREGVLDYTALLLNSIAAVCVKEPCKRCNAVSPDGGRDATADCDEESDDEAVASEWNEDDLPMQFGTKRRRQW